MTDNGSTDRSAHIAEEQGARVVHCPTRGYGAALQCGFQAARHDIIVFADADNTYDFRESPRLIEALEKGADLVIGSRLEGTIHPQAMPWLHRYIGTPVLSWLISLLYSNHHQPITDCNSGFRAFRRRSLPAWQVNSPGMEFASELLIKALRANARIAQMPISLYPDRRGRRPHLQTWRDGMRHLLQILLGAPQFFSVVGTTIFSLSWVILLAALFSGPRFIGPVSILGLHTMMFMLLSTHVGLTLWGIGLMLSAKQPTGGGLYVRLLMIKEDKLLWSLLVSFLLSAAMLLSIVISWAARGFENLSLEQPTLILITAASNVLVFSSQVMAGHLIKRM